MITEHLRDLAVSVAIFGFFASTWFGWAQEAPPPAWRRWLGAASVLSLLTLGAGVLLAVRHRHGGTVFDDDTSRTFGIVVGVEFAAAALGAGLLAWRRHAELMAAWIAFVVGVHLFPVAAIMDYPLVHVTGALITVTAAAAVPVARSRGLTPSAVVGAATGLVLLATAVVSAVAA
ncbi:hypothetical protein [Actinoplanes sp. NPDC020271]|uniref:hypothetical protein n=1 Tax=Actinoplanes sp. NPDC020271 TaxID=3363896 RepID=UPI00379B3A45